MTITAEPMLVSSDALDTNLTADIPCRTADPDLWFAEQSDQLEQAKALCRGCPLQQACLEQALVREEPWGVWGAEIFVDGVIVAHKRGRGRPRNDDRLRSAVGRAALTTSAA